MAPPTPSPPLPSALPHPPSAICHLRSALRHQRSRLLPSAQPPTAQRAILPSTHKIEKEWLMLRPGRIILFLLALASPLSAQSIKGRVVLQQDDSPLPGVTVSVPEWGLSAVTLVDGVFLHNLVGWVAVVCGGGC